MMPLVERFQRQRWSSTRKNIEKMKAGASCRFDPTDYFNCHSSVMRLNDAYDGVRRWKMKINKGRITVRREA